MSGAASLAVKVLGNASALQAALAQAEGAIQHTSAQMTSMVKSFDGSKILKDADLAAKAIGQLGGTSTLTAAEHAKLVKTVDGAIEKYSALGQKAPAHILALKTATETAEGSTSKWGVALSALGGALSATAVKGAIDHVAELTSHIADLAAKTGISAEAVQELDFAAKKNGTTFDAMSAGIVKMEKALQDGDKGAIGAIQSLGLNIDSIKGMAPDQAFEAIGNAIAKVKDPMTQAADAVHIFGKSGADELPIFKDNLSALREEAQKSGTVISNELVAKGDNLDDTITKLHGVFEALLVKVIVPMTPALTELAGWIGKAAEYFSQLPSPLQAVVAGAGLLVPILAPIALGFSSIATVVTPLVPLIGTALTGALGGVAALLGPGALLVAGIVGVYEAWKHWDKIEDFVKGVYDAVKTFIVDHVVPVLTAGGPLLNPIAAVVEAFKHWGDITAIAQALYTGIKTWIVDKVIPIVTIGGPLLNPVAGVVTIFQHWSEITTIAQNVYIGVKKWLIDEFASIVTSIKGKIDAVTGFFGDMYDKVIGHSFVPDMIKGIETHFGKLPEIMTGPADTATGKVQSFFSSLETNAGLSIGNLLGAIGSHFASENLNKLMTVPAAGVVGDVLGVFDRMDKGFGSILRNMAKRFETEFINSIISSLSGSSSRIASMIGGMLGGGGAAAGSGGGMAGAVGRAATGAGGTSAGGSEAAGNGAAAELGSTLLIFDSLLKWSGGSNVGLIEGILAKKGTDGRGEVENEQRQFDSDAAYLGMTPDEYANYIGQSRPTYVDPHRYDGLDGPDALVPAMASGGYVPARAGGTLVRVGEGGKGETIVPDGMSVGGRSVGGGQYNGPKELHIHVPRAGGGEDTYVIQMVNKALALGRIQVPRFAVTAGAAIG